MNRARSIIKSSRSKATIEGAGVHLKRAFGFGSEHEYDPFLLLDDFRSNRPEYYLSGFPFHPHRGIETITYVLKGKVEHKDSMGNSGIIGEGDVQWMTAGSGIIHQEMPEGNETGEMEGFQLWANLPAKFKMIPPRYREIKSQDIPEVTLDNGVKIRVICGTVENMDGPVKDVIIAPEYLDITVPAFSRYVHLTPPANTVFCYVISGKGIFSEEKPEKYSENETLLLFNSGEYLEIKTGEMDVRFLLVSGKPLNEPIAWYGPIVMNTPIELEKAFYEYQNGTFLKL